MAKFGKTDPLETAVKFAKQGQTQKSREISLSIWHKLL